MERRRIEDFGEKIPGARKDRQALETMMRGGHAKGFAGDDTTTSLSTIWPKANIVALVEDGTLEPWQGAWIKTLREMAGRTPPRRGHKRRRWEQRLAQLIRIAAAIASGVVQSAEDAARASEVLNGMRSLDGCAGMASDQARVLTEVHLATELRLELADYVGRLTGRLKEHGEAADKPAPWVLGRSTRTGTIEVGRDRCPVRLAQCAKEQVCAYAERERAKNEQRGSTGSNPYSVRRMREGGDVGVYRKIGRSWIKLKPCANADEAHRMIRTERETLDTLWASWRNIPPMRAEHNKARSGPACGRANGATTPERIERHLALRGVQFGRYVEQGRRQSDLDETMIAMCDLAETLDWETTELSFGRRLALAFGARGRGGKRAPKAHYEPAQRVINLTKRSGAGSLAHEWFHALDHECGRRLGSEGFATTLGKPGDPGLSGASAGVRFAIAEGTDLGARSAVLDRRRSSPYWATTIEMAARSFEAWVRWRLARIGVRNDYLVNLRSESEWAQASAGNQEVEKSYPYPTMDEIRALDSAMSRFMDTARE